jgi:hypothetical protein
MLVIAPDMPKTFLRMMNVSSKQCLFERSLYTFLFHYPVAGCDGCHDTTEGEWLALYDKCFCYGCETWSLTLREEHRGGVREQGAEEWRLLGRYAVWLL